MPILVTVLAADDSQSKMIYEVVELLGARFWSIDQVSLLSNEQILDSPLIVVVCDKGTGNLANEMLAEFTEPRLTKFILCGDPTLTVAIEAGQLGVKAIFDRTFGTKEIARILRQHFTAEVENSKWRQRRREFLLSVENLNETEREVMRQIADGMSNKLIAKSLYLSQRSIEGYRSKVFKKTKTAGVAELVRNLVEFAEQPSGIIKKVSGVPAP